MHRLPDDLGVQELIEQHFAIASLDLSSSQLSSIDAVAISWAGMIGLENESWALDFARGAIKGSWCQDDNHFEEGNQDSLHFGADSEKYVKNAEREFLSRYLFNHARDVFLSEQEDRVLIGEIGVPVATEATLDWATGWNLRREEVSAGLALPPEVIGSIFWLPTASDVYMPIGYMSIKNMLREYKSHLFPTFPLDDGEIEYIADRLALTDDDKFAAFALPISFGRSLMHAFPIVELAGNQLKLTGEVHIHTEGQANLPDAQKVVGRVEAWVRRSAGQYRGRRPLSRSEIDTDIQEIATKTQEWWTYRGRLPTKTNIAFEANMSEDTIDRRLKGLGGWTKFLEGIQRNLEISS